MVEIRPFRSIRYTEEAGDYKSLIVQPYDKIDQEMQKKYYMNSEYNYCRLTAPIEKNRYEVSKQRINQWIRKGVLRKDQEPSIFVYKQIFKLFRKTFNRTGFIAALRMHSYEENCVLPHETTHKEPKIDRLNMLRKTEKNLETGLLLYSDPEEITVNLFRKIMKTQPLIDAKDCMDVRNLVWRVTEKRKIKFIQEAVKNTQFVIADGHHRYETAIVYRDERRKQEEWTEDSAFNFRMSYMVPVEDEGLIILPTHRLLTKIQLTKETLLKLDSFFSVSEIDPKAECLENFLKSNNIAHVFCVYNGKRAYGLVSKNEEAVTEFMDATYSDEYRSLDAVVLKNVIFEGIMKAGKLRIDKDILYVRWINDALDRVNNGEAKLAFLVNSTTPEMVLKIARNLEKMPEKSTDFYPKMVSGLTMMDVSQGERL